MSTWAEALRHFISQADSIGIMVMISGIVGSKTIHTQDWRREQSMEKMPFHKMSGAGNDFILIDNREKIVDEKNLASFIKNVCCRKMSVGADGLILVENSDSVDFKWRFFNSDGSGAGMCGNGARCAARFAHEKKMAGTTLSFETEAGIVDAEILGKNVKLKMPDPGKLVENESLETDDGMLLFNFIETGVPHSVVRVKEIEKINVKRLGRMIRFHERFAPEGTNVNFVSSDGKSNLMIRTYERGVEDETLGCGTGAIASAIVEAVKTDAESPIRVTTKSRSVLTIYFNRKQDVFSDIFLEGDARLIYEGVLSRESWDY